LEVEMRLVGVDETSLSRPPTINKNFSLGEEYVRTASWMDDEETIVTVEVIAYASGIRAKREPDGSVDMLGQMSRFDVLGEDEFMQPVERAVFVWRRRRPAEDGTFIDEEEIDYSNEIGLFYQETLEAALANAKAWLDDLDFEAQFDPTAWEVPVG
jgi:hypothetical protein